MTSGTTNPFHAVSPECCTNRNTARHEKRQGVTASEFFPDGHEENGGIIKISTFVLFVSFGVKSVFSYLSCLSHSRIVIIEIVVLDRVHEIKR